jgi:integrase
VVNVGYVAGVDDNGKPVHKRKRLSAYGKTRKAVAERLPELVKRSKQELNAKDYVETVSDFMAYWMETSVTKNRAPRTIESYEGVIRNHVVPFLGSHRLVSLKRTDVQHMLDAVAAKTGVGPRSVQYVRSVTRNALNDAVKWGMIETNPAEHTITKRVPRPHRTALSVEQAQQLFALVAGDHFEALYIMAAVYGLRRGECLGLMWKDIDWSTREIRVRQQMVVVKSKPTLAELKTDASRRTLPLLGFIEEALDRRRVFQEEERLLAGSKWQETGLIFTTQVGTLFHTTNFQRQFKTHLKNAGLPPITFHSLRHTAASFMVALNVHPRIAMEILGHTNIATTMEIYSHAQQADMRGALESVENALRGGTIV